LKEEELRKLVPDSSSGYEDTLLHLEAAFRKSAPTGMDPQVAGKAAIDDLDFQLDPVRLALRAPRVRILLGDDVGLGKTLEAGLLASELVLRRQANAGCYAEGDADPVPAGILDPILDSAGQDRQRKDQADLVEDDDELRRMLDEPLEFWRVFLHPSQRKLVERNWNGPVLVRGGAGTGKTVVAMHRAKWLADLIGERNDPNGKVLFTTFTSNLAADVEENLGNLCSKDQLARIEVKHLGQARARARSRRRSHRSGRGVVVQSAPHSPDGLAVYLGDLIAWPWRDPGPVPWRRRCGVSRSLGPDRRAVGVPGGLDYLLGKSEFPVVARPYPAFRSWYEDGCRGCASIISRGIL
jgi:UvrD/REP helicase N-terminal domain